MKTALLLAIVVASPFSLRAQPDRADGAARSAETLETPEEIVARWPRRPAAAARAMIETYGVPSRFGAHALIWDDAGPWKRIIAYSNAWPMFTGATDEDFLEQTIERPVPARMVSALTRFDRGLRIDEETGQLSARAENEGENYLALNLAEEIISGARTPDEAKDFSRRTLDLAKAGKSSPYLAGFVFTRP